MQDQSEAPTTTVQCDVGNHHRCHGSIVSVTSAHGAACGCDCHRRDDDRIDDAKVWGEVA